MNVAPTSRSTDLRPRWALNVNRAMLVLFAALVLSIGVAFTSAGATDRSAAHEGHDDAQTSTSVAPETTSTLPSGGDLGNILPRPNSGREPETPGDPGGWQQAALFFVICGVIIGITLFVWWRSRVLRARRAADGLDPVTVARQHGGDVRAPRPPGIVD